QGLHRSATSKARLTLTAPSMKPSADWLRTTCRRPRHATAPTAPGVGRILGFDGLGNHLSCVSAPAMSRRLWPPAISASRPESLPVIELVFALSSPRMRVALEFPHLYRSPQAAVRSWPDRTTRLSCD